MGDLITELPVPEMNAIIELLDRLGVDREGLRRFRKASYFEQMTIAGMIQRGIVEVGDVVAQRILTHIHDFFASAHPAVTTTQKLWEDCGVKWMSENFKTQFVGLAVEAVDAGVLSVSRLEMRSYDATILSELGIKAETSLLHFAELLNSKCGSSETFIVHLRGLDGELWAVHARWFTDHGGWYVNAYSVANQRVWGEWGAGDVVVSLLLAGKEGK